MIVGGNALNIVPELLTIRDLPAIGALVDRNNKLFGSLHKLEEICCRCFHSIYTRIASREIGSPPLLVKR
jgi:hypothetical protein